MPDDPRRTRLAEIGRQKSALDAEALTLIRELQDDMMRSAGIPKADRERHLHMSDAERARIIGLQRSTKSGTIGTMDATPDTSATRISRARITKTNREHPFVAAFVAKRQKVHEVAKAIGYPRTTMQSWYRSDNNARPIPRAAVEIIQKLYGVPASAWRRITD